jgi:hypothetical protein
MVEGQLTGTDVAGHQQPALPGMACGAEVELDERPVVAAVALGAWPGGHTARLAWEPGGQRVGAVGSPASQDAVVARARQHVADRTGLQLGTQRGVGAVDLVAGHPAGLHPGVQCPGEDSGGQRRLGRKGNLVGDAGGTAAVGVLRPASWQVQLTVDQRVPSLGGVGQVDADLGIVGLAGGAGVLALHPDRRGALLEISGLIHHQDRLGIAEVLDHVGAHVVTHRLRIPDRPA